MAVKLKTMACALHAAWRALGCSRQAGKNRYREKGLLRHSVSEGDEREVSYSCFIYILCIYIMRAFEIYHLHISFFYCNFVAEFKLITTPRVEITSYG